MIEHCYFHGFNPHSLYLAVDGATELMQDAMGVNRDAIASWNERWETIFESGLFLIIVQISTYISIAAVVIWMANELKDFDQDAYLFRPTFYRNVLWSFFVMILLVGNGQRLADIVKGLHQFGQVFNQQALSYQLDNVALEDAIRASVGRGTLTADIQAQLGQCQAYVGQDQFNCLVNARQQVGQMIDGYEEDWLLALPDAYRDVDEELEYLLVPEGTMAGKAGDAALDFTIGNGGTGAGGDIGGRAGDAAGEGLSGELEDIAGKGFLGRVAGGVSGLFLGALGSVIQGFTHGILLAVQWAFVNSLEMAMLLTAMVAPFAVAASFVPGTGRPIIAWALAFVSMVMVQFYYNIFTGIIGVVIVNSNAHDMNGYLLVLAIFGPVLAIKLAQGGGIAVFEAISSGAVGVVMASMAGAMKAGK